MLRAIAPNAYKTKHKTDRPTAGPSERVEHDFPKRHVVKSVKLSGGQRFLMICDHGHTSTAVKEVFSR